MYIAAHVPWTDAVITVDSLGATTDAAIAGLKVEKGENIVQSREEFYRMFSIILRCAFDRRWTTEADRNHKNTSNGSLIEYTCACKTNTCMRQ